MIYPCLYMGKTVTLNTSLRLGHQPSDYNLIIREVQTWKRLAWPWSTSSLDSFPVFQSIWRFEDLQRLQFRSYAWLAARFLDAGFIVNFYVFLGMTATGLCIYLLVREFEINHSLAVLGGVTGQMMPWLRQNILYAPAGSWNTVGPLLIVLLLIRFRKKPTIGSAITILGGLLFCATLSGYAFFFSIFITLFVSLFELHHIYHWFQTIDPRRKVLNLVSGSLIIVSIVVLLSYLLNHTRSEFGTPFGVYDKQTVLNNAGTLKGFITPDHFHLILPRKDNYRIDGDDQNYAGIILVVLAFLGLIQIWRLKSLGQFKVLIISALGFLLLTLGRFHVGPVDIPSLREYARFIMPGVRQFTKAGLIFEHLLIVFAIIFISATLEKIPSKKLRITALVFAFLLITLDLNPSSRRVIWDYSNRFGEVRQILNQNPEKGLFVPNGVATFPTIGLQGLADVFNAPLYNDLIRVYPYAARGSAELAKYLASQEVEFVFARLEKNTKKPYMTGFIQDAAHFTTYLNEPDFSPVSQVVVLENRDDTGKVLETWSGRLLRVNDIPQSIVRSDEKLLAKFVSSPILEVRDASQNRFWNDVYWSVAKQITLTPETLQETTITSSEKISFRFHLRLVSPSEIESTGSLSYLVEVGSVVNRFEVTDNSEMIQIDVPKGRSAVIKSLANCEITSSENEFWGQLAQHEVCFGIAEYWVEAIISPQS